MAATTPAFIEEPTPLSFSKVEGVRLATEIDCLPGYIPGCKIAGICPNSAATLQVADLPQLQDLPQGQRRVDVGEIVDIHALGCGYYQLEFGSPYMAAREPLMHSLGPLMFMVPWADSYTNPLAEAQKFPQDSTNA